jgi:hypothetical protein
MVTPTKMFLANNFFTKKRHDNEGRARSDEEPFHREQDLTRARSDLSSQACTTRQKEHVARERERFDNSKSKRKIQQEQEQDPTRRNFATLFFSVTALLSYYFTNNRHRHHLHKSLPSTTSFFTSNINKCYPNNSPLQRLQPSLALSPPMSMAMDISYLLALDNLLPFRMGLIREVAVLRR